MFDTDMASAEQRVRIIELLDYYGALLADKRGDSLSLYFVEDLSLSEISELRDISRQGVRDSIRSGIQALEHADEKLGCMGRERMLELKLARAKELAAMADRGDRTAVRQIIDL